MRGMTSSPSSPSSLCAERISSHVRSRTASRSDQISIEVVAETGSTNADLLAYIQHSQGPQTSCLPKLLIAEQQTAGRGRAGRSWISAPSAALMFSLAWRFEQPLQKLVGLPLAVGVAIATGLNAFLQRAIDPDEHPNASGTDSGIRLKWPNDLLLGDSKLGGILIETVNADTTGMHADRATWAVIGVGINIAMPTDLQHQLGRSVANLPKVISQIGAPEECDRNLLMASLLVSLMQALEQFEQAGLGAFVTRWNLLHAHAGQQVVILDQGKILNEGTALGIDDIGRFLLQTTSAARPVAIMAGDVSLRVKEM